MKTKSEGKSSKTRHECNICHKIILGSTYKLRCHLYQHSAVDARHKCTFCGKAFYRRDIYQKHLAMHIGAVEKKLHICDHCDRSFVGKRNLISHLKIHEEIYDRAQYKCIACDTSYCEERLLKYHIRKQHFNLQNKDPGYITKMLNETWVERVMESKICVEMTKVNNNIINIKKSDVEIQTIMKRNDNCSKFNKYISSVFASQDKSQYSKAVCDYCNKEMLKKSLQPHIRERHLKIRRFQCEDCDATFKRHYQLVNHVCGKFKVRERK